MNMNDIFEVFEQLGVKSVVANNKVRFYDIASGLEMGFWEDKTKELSLDNLIMGKYYALFSDKVLRFQLDYPRIVGKAEKDRTKVILERTCYDDGHDFYIVDFVPERGIVFEFNTEFSRGNKIIVKSDNYIWFDIGKKHGAFDNGYDERSDLSEKEMREVLASNKYVNIFAEYYGKTYPGLLETIQNAKAKGATLK